MNDLVVAVDTETTGVDTNVDSICQLAGVAYDPSDGYTGTVFSSYCVPEADMTEGALEIHNITPDMYKWSPDEKAALNTLGIVLDDLSADYNLILAGHNHMRFDLPLMDRLHSEAKFQSYPIIDTLVFAYRMFPGKAVKLSEIYEWYVGKTAINAHDAAADCYMVCEIVHKMMDDTGKTAAQMAKECRIPTAWKIMPWGKHIGKKIEDVPTGYLGWMKKDISDPTPDLVATLNFVLGN